MTSELRRIASLAATILVASLAWSAAACGGSTTSSDIIFTAQAESREANATATAIAAATASAGLTQEQIDVAAASGGQGGIAGSLRATAEANATVQAASQSQTPASEATSTSQSSDEIPAGDPLTGEVTVEIRTSGTLEPRVIKVKVGTTVKWENVDGRSQHSTKATPDQAEQWDSGPMFRPLGSTENATYSHTFSTPGKYSYRSFGPADNADPGVIYVVE